MMRLTGLLALPQSPVQQLDSHVKICERNNNNDNDI
jgi:hypothetical protein